MPSAHTIWPRKGQTFTEKAWNRNRKIRLRIRVLGLGSEAPKIWLRREDPERSLRNVQNGSGSGAGGSVQAPAVTALVWKSWDQRRLFTHWSQLVFEAWRDRSYTHTASCGHFTACTRIAAAFRVVQRQRFSIMSAPNSAAKRFTHDWMIRFIELHPIETCFSTRTTRFGPFRPEQSPYDSISPYFKNLLRRYMPVIITAFKLTFKKEKIMIKYRYDSEKEEFTLPFHGKAVVIMSSIKFGGTDAGTLTKYLEKRVFCIDAAFVSGKNASFTPAEFVYLAKHTKEDFRFYKCTLTEQVSLTTAWPLIKRLEEIELYVKNLGIDEHTKQTVLHKPSEVRVTGFILYIECVSEDVIMAFVDCFLSCPVFPMMFEWRLISELESFDFKPVSEKIREKLIAAGYEQDESNGDNMNVLLPDDYVGNSVVVTTIDKLYHIIVLPRD